MTEREALLAAILEDPGDDTVRLVYADWLQEHDQSERAEFIRLQIASFRLSLPKVLRPIRILELGYEPEADDLNSMRSRRLRESPPLRQPTSAVFVCDSDPDDLRGHIIDVIGTSPKREEYRICGCLVMDATRRASDGLVEVVGTFVVPDPFTDQRKRHEEILKRERELVEAVGTDAMLGGDRFQWDFWSPVVVRGFVEAIRIPGGEWSSFGDDILGLHPVKKVTFTGTGPTFDTTQNRYLGFGTRNDYLVAGKWIELGEEEALAAFGLTGRQGVARLVLSARWPSIKTDGWTFPRAGIAV